MSAACTLNHRAQWERPLLAQGPHYRVPLVTSNGSVKINTCKEKTSPLKSNNTLTVGLFVCLLFLILLIYYLVIKVIRRRKARDELQLIWNVHDRLGCFVGRLGLLKRQSEIWRAEHGERLSHDWEQTERRRRRTDSGSEPRLHPDPYLDVEAGHHHVSGGRDDRQVLTANPRLHTDHLTCSQEDFC